METESGASFGNPLTGSKSNKFKKIPQQAGVRRDIEVLLHDDIDVPMTYGFEPVILLPIDAWTWNETELRQVFVHELEHIKRFDWSVQVMARVACAVYWFQPLVWMTWRKLCLEAERSCDDAAVAWCGVIKLTTLSTS